MLAILEYYSGKIMKHFLLLFVLCFLGQAVYSQDKPCPKNSDSLYDRREVLVKLSKSLEKSVNLTEEFSVKNDRAVRFIIYDLTNPLNNSIDGAMCVDFIEGHVYHFAPLFYDTSQSSIAVLQNGEIKIFERTNCGDIDKNLKEVLTYLKNNSQKIVDFENTFKRTANYRRYASWLDKHNQNIFECKVSPQIPPNPDKLYERYSVFRDMEDVLFKYLPEKFFDYNFIDWIENERAVGFYVQDLVDVDNKQTNLIERVDFKEGHVYQFGWIDAPYSVSHFAILKDGDINFFEAIDCHPDRLKKTTDFIKNNFKEGTERRELLKRIENYKNYRFSIEFAKKLQPQCK